MQLQTQFEKIRSRFTPAHGIALAIVCLILGVAYLFRSTSAFPNLPIGAYVGVIDKVGAGESQQSKSATLYVERLPDNYSLLIVVFSPGWKPEVIPVEFKRKSRSESDDRYLEPVTIIGSGSSYTLTGDMTASGAAGSFSGTDGRSGNWTLHSVSAEDLRPASVPPLNPVETATYLRGLARLKDDKKLLESLREENRSYTGKIQKFEASMENADELRQKSESTRQALADELNRVAEQRKKNTEALKNTLAELSAMQRITKHGRSIDVARRIARREARWYQVNWSAHDSTDVEQELAQQQQIDLEKLNEAAKRASEIQRLKEIIAQESTRIAQLQSAAPREPSSAPTTTAPRSGGAATPAPTSKPWWQVWDN